MAFKSLIESFHQIVDRIEDYGTSTAEYYKLRLFKSTMKGGISLVNLLVFGSLFLFVLLFLSIGAAFWLASFFENIYTGFFLVGAFYGVLVILMFAFGRRAIERYMLYKFSGLLYDEDELKPKETAERELKEYQEVLQKENDPEKEESIKY